MHEQKLSQIFGMANGLSETSRARLNKISVERSKDDYRNPSNAIRTWYRIFTDKTIPWMTTGTDQPWACCQNYR
jgi:hypothetical protein